MPLEKNVEYSASAQQALTLGYRPCLRCRPDSAPQSCAWQGANTTVQRALKLLSERVDKSIESIADSLGVSTRYLNKLLQQHIQMSAKQFRIYQQVLMAKTLLQQTNLSVEKVAESVGFASARQLQQHLKTHLRLTPSQLRKQSENESLPLQATQLSQSVKILLAYRPPYNWPQVRDFFARREIKGNERIHATGLCKVLCIHSQSVAIEITHLPKQYGFEISFNSAYSQFTLHIIAIVRRMLDLDASPNIIAKALLKAGLQASELVEGLRIPGVASEFEAGCRAILGQQVSVSAAVNKVNQLHEFFANNEPNQNNEMNAKAQSTQRQFALASEIAKHDLLFLKMPAKRRQTLLDLAAHYEQINKQKTNQFGAYIHSENTTQHNVKNLIDIKGIGPWTVNYVELRALGEADIWLDTDLVIKQQIAKLQANNRKLTPELAAPWRSYLTLNLWSLAS